MEVGRILPTEAAVILNVSPQFIRIAMQQGKLPIGTAVQMSSIWTYHISEKLLADYSGKDIQAELERMRKGHEQVREQMLKWYPDFDFTDAGIYYNDFNSMFYIRARMRKRRQQ